MTNCHTTRRVVVLRTGEVNPVDDITLMRATESGNKEAY